MWEYRFRLAAERDREAIIGFVNSRWESQHPLVNLPDFFAYYYEADSGKLNFALAEREGELCAVAGFIPSSIKIKPDVWVSLWVADKAANGSGLELMAALPGLTGCRTLACNNIRPETRLFYDFLGYTTGRMGHFYRLARREHYTLARVPAPCILPAGGSAQLVQYKTAEELDAGGFIPPENANPYKDFWYIHRRYFAYPHASYRVYGVLPKGTRAPTALLCCRVVPAQDTCVLRIADFIGPAEALADAGTAIDALIRQVGAEYADLYCAGIDPDLLARAGFSERAEDDEAVIPNYLSPPVYENTDYYYFTSNPGGFTMFKADGDQDRPNLPLPD